MGATVAGAATCGGRMCVVVFLLPLLAAAASAHAQHPDCFETAHNRLKYNSTKQCRVVEYPEEFNRWKRPLPVLWEVVDAELGVVRATFPLLYGEGVSSYAVSLAVNESVATPQQCGQPGTFSLDREDLHSKTTFYPHKCTNYSNADSSTKALEVEFRFVFSGCYRLKVAPSGNPNNVSAGRFLTTSYLKEVLHSPNVTTNFYQNKNVAFVSFKFCWGSVPLVVSMRQGVRPQLGRQACQTSGTIYSCCLLNLPDVGSKVCERDSTQTKNPDCKYEPDGVTCEFFDLVPGNYCFTAEVLNDVRCNTYGNVWNRNTCLWNTPIVISAEPGAGVSEEHVIQTSPWSEGVWYFLGPALAVCVLLGLVSYGYRLHGRKPARHQHTPPDYDYSRPEEDSSSTTTTAALKPRGGGGRVRVVLLLYAQDCRPFMELMGALRSLLSELTQCEVLDVLEPDLSLTLLEEMAVRGGPQEWLRGLLASPACLVVVVESPCAVLLQRALSLGRPAPHYAAPLPNSGLFLYALQAATNTHAHADLYARFHVVRFKGWGEDSSTLSHVTPYRRFTLPGHLANLVSSLRDSGGGGLSSAYSPEEEAEEALAAALDRALLYRRSCPDYLHDIFLKTHC